MQDNHETINVKGNGNVFGNGNRVKNIHNYNPPPPKPPRNQPPQKDKDDAAGYFIGIAFILMMAGWLFVRYSQYIFSIIAILSIVSVLMTAYPVVTWLTNGGDEPDIDQKFAWGMSLVLSVASLKLCLYGHSVLTDDIVQLGIQSQTFSDFWKALNWEQIRIVERTGTAAPILFIAVLQLVLLALYNLCAYLWASDFEESRLFDLLHKFRASRGGILTVFFLVLVWLCESGIWIEFFTTRTH